MTNRQLVLGLDYGTTNTGVSYCEVAKNSKQPEQIDIVHNWPSKNTKSGTKEKVPSEIAYTPDGILWGSLIPSNVPRHVWSKLSLENSSPAKGPHAKVKGEISVSSGVDKKEPVDIVADFLREVKAHVIKNLDQKYSHALWTTLPIVLVVTFPAVWSDAAKARTLEAVRKAGFNETELPQLREIILATEPECAAIYTIKSLQDTVHNANFSIGDGFTVCDMGGGTVDLISYRITSLKPIKVEEATIGGGDQCGGSFVDRAFLELLENKLGTEDFVKLAGVRSDKVSMTFMAQKIARVLQDFSLEAKSGFSGTEINFIRLPPPLSGIELDEARGITDGEIRIDAEDMQKVFEYCIRRTYELIAQQLKQMRKQKNIQVKYIFLVGGFSESPYVFNKVQEFFETAYDLKVLKPDFAWSAVARGAAAKGIEGDNASISQRKCRRHYGTSTNHPFVPGNYLDTDAYIDEFSGEKRAINQVDWLLHKGQDLHTSKGAHAKLELFSYFWPGDAKSFTLRLLAADCARGPKRSVSQEVYTAAVVDLDLSIIPDYKFQRYKNDQGQTYLCLEYHVEITIGSTIEYALVKDGVKYGSLTATYE